jgi:hypothetical protein
MSSHIEPKALPASDRSTRSGSTWESNTVCTPRHYGVGTARAAKSVAGTATINAVLLLISGASCEQWRQRMAEEAVLEAARLDPVAPGEAPIFKSPEASAERCCRQTAPTADRRSRG